MLTEQEAEALFREWLVKNGLSTCPGCGREIDRGDVAWNNPCTEAGTDYTTVHIECQGCQTEIADFNSWFPEADTFETLVEYVLEDGP
jgi:hypothetical protein